jgi:hypothetical protein
MAVCRRCARIALEPFPDDEECPVMPHSPSVLLLLTSAATCPLCRYFLSLFKKETLGEFARDAKRGIRTRSVLRAVSRKRFLEAENRMIKREFVLVSPTRDVASWERFVIGSSGGWYSLITMLILCLPSKTKQLFSKTARFGRHPYR